MKNSLILTGIMVGVSLLFIATLFYPGGSSQNELSTGYDWFNNYISNLLSPQAVNGLDNPARPWAIGGVLFLTASFGLFFVRFAQKINDKNGALVIKYLGIAVTILAFLTVSPTLHDAMVTFSSILTLIIFFYITVFVLKSKLFGLKILSILFLLTFYLGAFMYFTRTSVEYLPLMQKVIFLIKIVWVLTLEYFVQKEDFSSHKILKPN